MSITHIMQAIAATPEQEAEFRALPVGEPRRLKMLAIMQANGLTKQQIIERIMAPLPNDSGRDD